MYLPKRDIYNSLSTLNYFVSQTQPATFEDLPAIIFNVGNNSVDVDLNNTIISQDIEVNIDIWAEDSVTASNVLNQVEEIMRQLGYNMSYSSDVPNICNLYHINCRFTTIA